MPPTEFSYHWLTQSATRWFLVALLVSVGPTFTLLPGVAEELEMRSIAAMATVSSGMPVMVWMVAEELLVKLASSVRILASSG